MFEYLYKEVYVLILTVTVALYTFFLPKNLLLNQGCILQLIAKLFLKTHCEMKVVSYN